MINQGVTAALAAHDTNRNGDDSHTLGTGRSVQVAHECTYLDFLKCQPLNFKGTEGVVGLSQWGKIKKLETDMWELKTKGTDVIGYSRRFQELALMCDRMFPEESDRVEKYIDGLPDTIHDSTENKRKQDDNNNQAQQQPLKKQGVAIAYTAGPGERKEEKGHYANQCSKANNRATGKHT
nr:hypothetical protein [Tanacetum cinerariifolium]